METENKFPRGGSRYRAKRRKRNAFPQLHPSVCSTRVVAGSLQTNFFLLLPFCTGIHLFVTRVLLFPFSLVSFSAIFESVFSQRVRLTNEGAFALTFQRAGCSNCSTTMDSMRSLNTSLPSSTPRPQPPEQLLQSFKAAALSVTNLYKNAVCEQAQAKQAGYQEAVEDLLQFLDKGNLGLGDGEGWSVRQWATERLDGNGVPGSDDDDTEKRDRSTTPAAVRRDHLGSETTQQQPKSTPAVNSAQIPPQPQQQPPPPQQRHQTPPPQPTPTESNVFDRPTIFTFTSGPSLPQSQEQDVDMQPSENTSDNAPVSVSVLPRNSRPQNRFNNLSRSNPRASAREPSVGVGSKRKLAVPDFFDLSGLGHNNRDTFGGNKRGRFT